MSFVSKAISTRQYATFSIFCTIQNTNTQPQITLLVFYLHFRSFKTNVTIQSLWKNWHVFAEIYLKWSKFSFYDSSFAVGQQKLGKLLAFSNKFCTSVSKKFLCSILISHDTNFHNLS